MRACAVAGCEGTPRQGYRECGPCMSHGSRELARLTSNAAGEWTGGRENIQAITRLLLGRLEVLPDEAFIQAKPSRGARAIWRGVPQALGEAVDGSIETTDALAVARRFYASRDLFLCLAGGTGCGKSFAAACLVAGKDVDPDAMRDPVLPKWQTASAIVSALEEWDKGAEDRMALRCIRASPILVIDDMGEEVATERANARLRALICEREAKRFRTVITTNATQQAFAGRYGDRLLSRILGAGIWHDCTGADMRRG